MRARGGAFGLVLAASIVAGVLSPVVAVAQETMDVDEIQPGMTGYGLSVFEGTAPTRFHVEVIAVLRDFLPHQDIILIRCAGQGLERSRIVAGMSGSPIYIEDRLVGALAYGWSFSQDPIAGVTPIRNMLEAFSRERRVGAVPGLPGLDGWLALGPSPSGRGRLPALREPGEGGPEPLPTPMGQGEGGVPLVPLEAPLLVSGLSGRAFRRLEGELAPRGLFPVQGGGAGTGGRAGEEEAPLVPGSALGVQLARGDIDLTAIGTVTYVDGDRLLAFGHPFLGGGYVEAPLTSARIHAVFNGVQRSFKFGSPGGPVGSMTQDIQACIMGRTGVEAAMIPVRVTYRDGRNGVETTFAVDVIDSPLFTPMLLDLVMMSATDSAMPTSEDMDVRVHVTARHNGGRTFEYQDRYHVPGGFIDAGALQPIGILFQNTIARFRLEALDVQFEALPARPVAEIRAAFLGQSEVHAGEQADLFVVLKPFGEPAALVRMPIHIPGDVRPGPLLITVGAGPNFAPDLPPPMTLDDLIQGIANRYRSTDLVTSLVTSTFSVKVGGRNLQGLPGSVVDVLQPLNGAGAIATANMVRFVLPTEHILTGYQRLVVPVVE